MTIVETRFGKLQGSREGGVLRFAGIPFAKAKRWQMPEAPDSWSGVRDATKFAAIAVQEEKQPNDILKGPPGPHSEDCLHLNIWTPAADGATLPPRARLCLVPVEPERTGDVLYYSQVVVAADGKRLQHHDEGRKPHGQLGKEVMKCDGEGEVQAMNQEGAIHEDLNQNSRLNGAAARDM